MKNIPNNSFQQIANYLAGDISSAEAENLKNNIMQNEQDALNFRKINQVWELRLEDRNISKKIHKKTFRKISGRKLAMPFRTFSKYAAACILLVGLSTAVYFLGRNFLSIRAEYISNIGEIKHFSLPDGSEVWLNSKSRLTYTKYPWGDKRNVSLEGEAYFSVFSNKKHPFLVTTLNAVIKATGTKFSVSAYEDDPYTNTYLEEGHVSFTNKNNNKNYKISPNQLVTLNQKTQALNTSLQHDKKIFSWKEGTLHFYDESLDNISRKLERKFGIKILFANQEIQKLRYTAEFEKENLMQILQFFCIASELKIKQEDATYIISFQNSVLPMNK